MEIMAAPFGDDYGPTHYLPVSVDFTSVTWNTVATHEVFTVTGLARVRLIPVCTENMAGANNMKCGTASNIGAAPWIATTVKVDIDADEVWLTATPAATYPLPGAAGTGAIDAIVYGDDIGYEIETAAATDGTIVFHLWWTALEPGATVVAGAGGVL